MEKEMSMSYESVKKQKQKNVLRGYIMFCMFV